MNTPTILVLAGILATNASAVVVARYDFDPNSAGAGQAAVTGDTSAQMTWTTTALVDNATGTGALGGSNQEGSNRSIAVGASGNLLRVSSNREGDAQTPLATGGDDESTWFSFTVAPIGGAILNFAGSSATIDTYANHGLNLGGSVSADWTLYFSTNGGSSWTSLGTFSGAATTGAGQEVGPAGLTWDLTALGNQSSAVDFIIDAESTGSTNGTASQRGVGFDNLTINASIIPEPAIGLLSGLGFLLLIRRQRRA